MSTTELFNAVSEACVLKGFSLQSFCNQHLGCSKTTLKKALEEPEKISNKEKIDTICEVLGLDIIAMAKSDSSKNNDSPNVSDNSPSYEDLQREVERLMAENNSLSEQLRQATDPTLIVEGFLTGKVVLDFPDEKRAQADYINNEVLPQALEHKIISYPGELLVKTLTYAQGGKPIKKAGFIPASNKRIDQL